MPTRQQTKWYVDGLRFECAACGSCCAGPAEGYIWITAAEIARLAAFLKMDEQQVRNRYIRREGMRTTIAEEPRTKDCVFLTQMGKQRGCRNLPRPTKPMPHLAVLDQQSAISRPLEHSRAPMPRH